MKIWEWILRSVNHKIPSMRLFCHYQLGIAETFNLGHPMERSNRCLRLVQNSRKTIHLKKIRKRIWKPWKGPSISVENWLLKIQVNPDKISSANYLGCWKEMRKILISTLMGLRTSRFRTLVNLLLAKTTS